MIKMFERTNESIGKVIRSLTLEQETEPLNRTDMFISYLFLLAMLIAAIIVAPVALYDEIYQRYQQSKQRKKQQKMRA